MPGDTPMPLMSVKGDPATWARVGDTIRVVRLKPYGREFDYVVESVDRWGFAVNRTDCRGKGNGEFYGEYPGDYAVVSRAAPKPDAPAPAPLAFDAALAALDVEPTHHTDRMVTTYDILGIDAVRAAHRAEVDAARLSKADEAFFDAAIALWQAQERVTELDREAGALDRDRDRLREAMRRFMQTGDESRMAEWRAGAPQAVPGAERGDSAHRAEVERAVADEREACAKACEAQTHEGARGCIGWSMAQDCSAAIRARGVAKPRTAEEDKP